MALRASAKLYQHRGHVLATAPASRPVDAADLKTYLAIEADDEITITDAEANAWIDAAVEFIQEETGLALITQSWTVSLDRWPTGVEPWWDGVREGAISMLAGPYRSYELPRYPLISVDTVNTYDEASNETAVTIASTFDIDVYSKPGRMTLMSTATWPIALRSSNAIVITYTAGYGDAEDVPAPLKQAVLMLAGYLWEHKGECDLTGAYTKSGSKAMVSLYEVKRV